jgi:deoxyribose-phosphate aldolase
MTLTPAQIARLIDHTILKADASRDEVEKVCREALQYNFRVGVRESVECSAGGRDLAG